MPTSLDSCRPRSTCTRQWPSPDRAACQPSIPVVSSGKTAAWLDHGVHRDRISWTHSTTLVEGRYFEQSRSNPCAHFALICARGRPGGAHQSFPKARRGSAHISHGTEAARRMEARKKRRRRSFWKLRHDCRLVTGGKYHKANIRRTILTVER